MIRLFHRSAALLLAYCLVLDPATASALAPNVLPSQRISTACTSTSFIDQTLAAHSLAIPVRHLLSRETVTLGSLYLLGAVPMFAKGQFSSQTLKGSAALLLVGVLHWFSRAKGPTQPSNLKPFKERLAGYPLIQVLTAMLGSTVVDRLTEGEDGLNEADFRDSDLFLDRTLYAIRTKLAEDIEYIGYLEFDIQLVFKNKTEFPHNKIVLIRRGRGRWEAAFVGGIYRSPDNIKDLIRLEHYLKDSGQNDYILTRRLTLPYRPSEGTVSALVDAGLQIYLSFETVKSFFQDSVHIAEAAAALGLFILGYLFIRKNRASRLSASIPVAVPWRIRLTQNPLVEKLIDLYGPTVVDRLTNGEDGITEKDLRETRKGPQLPLEKLTKLILNRFGIELDMAGVRYTGYSISFTFKSEGSNANAAHVLILEKGFYGLEGMTWKVLTAGGLGLPSKGTDVKALQRALASDKLSGKYISSRPGATYHSLHTVILFIGGILAFAFAQVLGYAQYPGFKIIENLTNRVTHFDFSPEVILIIVIAVLVLVALIACLREAGDSSPTIRRVLFVAGFLGTLMSLLLTLPVSLNAATPGVDISGDSVAIFGAALAAIGLIAFLIGRMTPRKAKRQLVALFKTSRVSNDVPDYLPRLIHRFGAIPLLQAAQNIGPRFRGIFDALGRLDRNNPETDIYQEDLFQELRRSFNTSSSDAAQEAALGSVLSAARRFPLLSRAALKDIVYRNSLVQESRSWTRGRIFRFAAFWLVGVPIIVITLWGIISIAAIRNPNDELGAEFFNWLLYNFKFFIYLPQIAAWAGAGYGLYKAFSKHSLPETFWQKVLKLSLPPLGFQFGAMIASEGMSAIAVQLLGVHQSVHNIIVVSAVTSFALLVDAARNAFLAYSIVFFGLWVFLRLKVQRSLRSFLFFMSSLLAVSIHNNSQLQNPARAGLTAA